MLFNILPRGLVNALDLQILDVRSVDYMGDLIMALVKQRREDKRQQWNDFLEMIVTRIDENQLNVTNDEIISHCVVGSTQNSQLNSHSSFQLKLAWIIT